MGIKSMRVKIIVAACAVCCLLVVNQGQCENWPSWRGPNQNGTAIGQDFPVEWTLDSIAWKVDFSGKSGSTPIVWGDKIFLTLGVDGTNTVVCLNREGKEQWRTSVGKEKPGKHKKGSGANSSPVTDGTHLYVYFKSGDLAALDFSGKVVWQENLQKMYGEDTLWWDLGTSPVLTSSHVVVACMQSLPSPSYLAAFDKKTGKEAWKVDRETGAPEEAAQSYSTPIVTTYQGDEQIVVLGADFVTCHSAKDGKELWRVGTLNPDQERYWRSIASPVIAGDIVLAPYARGNTLTAIRMGGSGDVTKSHVLWMEKGLSADVPTPTVRGKHVFVTTDKGTIGCLDVETGKEVWKTTMEKNRRAYSSSPILANGVLYVTREDAKTFAVDTKTHQVKAINTLGKDEFVVATPVFIGGDVLIRTFEHLYCIRGKKASN